MLPKGWVETEASEVGTWGSGGTPKSTDATYYNGNIPWIRSGDLPDRQITRHEIEITESGLNACAAKWVATNSVLIALYGATIGKIGLTTYPVTTNQAVAFCTPYEGINPHYLARYFLSIREKLISLGQGGAQPNISQIILKQQIVPLPPLAEQHRIVTKLDSLTARIARARAELERVQVLKKHLKYKATQAIFSTNSRWPTVKLQDLVSDGPTNGWSPSTDSTAQGTLSLKLTATTSGYIRLDNAATKRIHETVPYDSKFWLKSGDILIQRANALEHLGVSAIFYGPEKKYIYPDLMMRVRVQDENLSRLIWYFLNSPNTRKHFRENATGTAGNMPKINGKIVKQLLVPVPPSGVRVHLVKSLDTLFARADRLETEAERALTLLNRLEASLLAKAFQGELIPQDPKDEPASVLLDRIRAERAAAPKPKRGRRQSTQDMPLPRKRQTKKHG
ncbi:restriction endonuclease subunit S [Gluconobacter albidus]|uniref:restriction endonuclease subunit S n=1 Tax=Gluconobacter albidus TaxID=318683 RepID=UPI0030964E1B